MVPSGAITAVMPLLVERISQRPASRARKRAICNCWCGAAESPNQALLVALTRSVAVASASSWSPP